MINVTKPNLPELSEFMPYLEEIWESGVLTNNGRFHQELERALAEYLGLSHVSLVCNATIGLMLAQEVLGLRGSDVITTPYSFAATAHSIMWMANRPIFVDIEPDSACLDPNLIERALTQNTKAIMPLHCYGNTCRTDAIQQIAQRHNLKVIYDACHSFGVTDDGGSVLRHGDISVISFHATKIFNTFEGGLIVAPDEETKIKVDRLKNFGFLNEEVVTSSGINGKLNEVSAAFGLVQLNRMEGYIAARAEIDRVYRARLAAVPGVKCLEPARQIKRNYAYFPVIVEESFPLSRENLYRDLRHRGIGARRYFYPLITDFDSVRGRGFNTDDRLTNASALSSRVLCLPLYPALSLSDVEFICDSIEQVYLKSG